MKILLVAINAKYIHSNLAVYSLRAYAKPYEIEIVEFTINHMRDDILADIYKQHADIVCFSCYIWNLEMVEAVMHEYHKLCPEVPIWLGGPEVSYESEAFLQEHPEVTGIMVGEGEETFRELCECYKTGADMEQITGIVFRRRERDGKEYLVKTASRAPMDLSCIPFCYDRMEDFANRIIYYESSRGCPFSCSYCLSSVDKTLRFRDIELVKEELLFFLERKVPQVKFVDRTFNCNHSHAQKIWQFIKENDNGVTNFHFEISADLLQEEEIKLLSQMRPGLVQLEIGVQSTNEVTIAAIQRTMQLNRLKEVVSSIRNAGNIHQHLDLIAGLPYEDYKTFRQSFDEVYALKPDQLQLGFLKVLKGSYMYEHAEEYGLIYRDRPPYEVLSTQWLSYEEVLLIKQIEEMLEIYYNSNQYPTTMWLLEKLFDSAFELYFRLGGFYGKKGYFGMSHSRNRRCEILLEFLQEECTLEEKQQMLFEEALTFDLYLRENCKSRPDWAGNPLEWKQLTRRYCTDGKLSHLEPFHYDFRMEQPIYREEALWVLFHYNDRNPLNHQARAEHLEIIEEELWQQKEQKRF